MINGLDPILIFAFFKNMPSTTPAKDIGIVASATSLLNQIAFPPIPVYLSETITGIYVDTEDKNIEIDTTTETNSAGSDPIINQKGLISTVKINMIANKNSVVLSALMALVDLILPKVTSKECSITYLNGAITVFAGKLHSFSVSQDSDTTLMKISMELIKGTTPAGVDVQAGQGGLNSGTQTSVNNTAPTPTGGTAPPPTGPGPGGGASIPIGTGGML